MAGKHNYNTFNAPISNLSYPFTIDDWDGEGTVLGTNYMVNSGIVYSKYSFNTGSFVPFENFNGKLTYQPNNKIFIEFNIMSNLQCSGAIIKCEKVGIDAPEGGWTSYPDLYKIEPGDEYDDKGRVKIIRDGKRQTKAYMLIGYTTEDANKNGDVKESSSSSSSTSSSSSSSSSSIPAPTWIQILDSNLIMVATVVSGVPCTIPFPYFYGGLKHNYACINPNLVDTL